MLATVERDGAGFTPAEACSPAGYIRRQDLCSRPRTATSRLLGSPLSSIGFQRSGSDLKIIFEIIKFILAVYSLASVMLGVHRSVICGILDLTNHK